MASQDSITTSADLKSRVKALGMELVVADDGAQFVLGGESRLDVIFSRRHDVDEKLEHWLEQRESVARHIGICVAELRRLKADFAQKPLDDVLARLRAYGYTVGEKRDGNYRIAKDGWSEEGVRFFAALLLFVEPITGAVGDMAP